MPRLVLLAAALTLSPAVYAQSVDGWVQIRNAPETAESGGLVDLFAAFRDGDHQIVFSFDGDPAAFILFSEVRHDGRVLGRFESLPHPYIPGDMFMAPEAFGFIGVLLAHTDDWRLEPGRYEVRLEARPVGSRDRLRPAVLAFDVR